MLLNLHVKNLALIRETEVEFGPGLNIMSGETGAGKSIIIGSVNLALGERVPRGMLRQDGGDALVELIFQVDNPHQLEALQTLDLYPEDGEFLMTRKILANGRSICRINSETVSASLMRKAASILIDIHGQHEHQSLLVKKNHIRYLDAYGAEALEDPLKELNACYQDYREVKSALEEASLDEEQQKRELDFLQYEISEIDEAELVPGEDDTLEAEYRRMSNGRKILEAAGEVRELCAEGMGNASDNLGRAASDMMAVAGYDPGLETLAEQLGEIDTLLNDFNRDLADYLADFEFSEEQFAEVEDRLDRINTLKTKYGRTIELILESREEKAKRADQLLHYEEYISDLQRQLKQREQALCALCDQVTGLRMTWGEKMSVELREALKDLNFLDVKFELEFQKLDHYTSSGRDEVRFLISTNPGEPLRPLDTVASGGELSRIMLAIKTVLAEKDDTETLIFDEIDSGISGRTAQMVGRKLKDTARDHQIICITHLPQIAAMADSHFLIEKTAEDGNTISRIHVLDQEESVMELARMLGGADLTETVLATAREMKGIK